MTCDRCKRETNATIMSMFNKERICIWCKNLERQHENYHKIAEAEIKAIHNGNFNCIGIGKPDDL